MILGQTESQWDVHSIVMDCQRLMAHLHGVSLAHCPRNANQVADWVAKALQADSLVLNWTTNPPPLSMVFIMFWCWSLLCLKLKLVNASCDLYWPKKKKNSPNWRELRCVKDWSGTNRSQNWKKKHSNGLRKIISWSRDGEIRYLFSWCDYVKIDSITCAQFTSASSLWNAKPITCVMTGKKITSYDIWMNENEKMFFPNLEIVPIFPREDNLEFDSHLDNSNRASMFVAPHDSAKQI